MSDRLTAAQLRLIADQLENGEAEISDSYFRFTPPATTYLQMTVTLVTHELPTASKDSYPLSGQSLHVLKENSRSNEDTQ